MILKLTLCTLIFVSSSATIGILLCDFFGHLTLIIALGSLFLGLLSAVLSSFNLSKKAYPFEVSSKWNWVMIAIFSLAMFIHFYWLLYEKNGVAFVTDASNFVDLPNHIMYTNYFNNGATFWPKDPFYLTSRATYPFGMDFFTSLFSKLGVTYMISFPIIGVCAGLLLLSALYFWGGGFALAAFLFAGGAYNFKFLSTLKLIDYQNGKPWQSILPLFSSQRGYLYAMPAGLILLWSWRNRFFPRSDKKQIPLPPLLEGFLWGTLPYFHVHTFVYLSLVFVCWAVASKNLRAALATVAWAFPIATFEMAQTTNFFRSTNLIGLKPGWMIGSQNVPLFFWNNYAFFGPLALLTVYFSWKHKNAFKQIFPSAALYLVCFVILFCSLRLG